MLCPGRLTLQLTGSFMLSALESGPSGLSLASGGWEHCVLSQYIFPSRCINTGKYMYCQI